MGQNRNIRLTGQVGGRSAHSRIPGLPDCWRAPRHLGHACPVRRPRRGDNEHLFIDKTAGEGVDSRAREHVERVHTAVRGPIQGRDPRGGEDRGRHQGRVRIAGGILTQAPRQGVDDAPLELTDVGGMGGAEIRIVSHDAVPAEPRLPAFSEIVELAGDRAGVLDQHRSQRFQGRLARRPTDQTRLHQGHPLGVSPDHRRLFGWEIVEERPGRHVGSLGDVLDRDIGEAPFGHQLQRGIAQRPASRQLLAVAPTHRPRQTRTSCRAFGRLDRPGHLDRHPAITVTLQTMLPP